MSQDTEKVHKLLLAADIGKKNESYQHLWEVNKLHIVLLGKDLIELGKLMFERLVSFLAEEIVKDSFELFDACCWGK